MPEEDLPDPGSLAALHAACFTTPRPWSETEIRDMLASPHVFCHRLEGGFLLGQAIAGEAELLTIAVSPDQRRQGLGQSLLEAFFVTATSRTAETAFLEVAASNAAAIALYLRAGFVQAGRRKGYYQAPDGSREDAIVMSRTL